MCTLNRTLCMSTYAGNISTYLHIPIDIAITRSATRLAALYRGVIGSYRIALRYAINCSFPIIA